MTTTWPAERTALWSHGGLEQDAPALSAAWERSQTGLARLRERLELRGIDGLVCAGVTGSLGRMEFRGDSDLDLIVIADDALDADAARRLHAQVWEQAEALGHARPRGDGIYVLPTTPRELLGAPFGQIAEPLRPFGIRLQMLQEAQPMVGGAAWNELVRAVVDRYAARFVVRHSATQWTWLINDLIRYHRSLAVGYQWEQLDDPGAWRLRNVKFRYSRVLKYAGLLFLLGESGRDMPDKAGWLASQLRWTPLERVYGIMARRDREAAANVLRLYETYAAALEDAAFVAELRGDEENRPLAFERLMANADELVRELWGFVVQRSGWPVDFLQRLAF
jgi:hypothetical protein